MAEMEILDKESVIPFYHQIKTQLKEKIRSQEYESGDILPSENELAQKYAVSRNTVRRALQDMINEGLIKSEKGKGYYVREAKLEQNLFRFYNFFEDYSINKGRVDSILLYRNIVNASLSVSSKLNIPQNSKVHKIVRLRQIKDKPIILETSFVSAEQYNLSTFCDDKYKYGCIYDILRDHYNIQIGKGEEYLEPIKLNKYQAEQLNVNENDPALLVDAIIYTVNNKPVELKRSIIRGEKMKFKLHYNFHV